MVNKSAKNAPDNCQVTSPIEQHLETMGASYLKISKRCVTVLVIDLLVRSDIFAA